MGGDSSGVEQAVARTLRDSLGRIQSASEELNQAINDLTAACASSRPANALSPMVRAQTSAASLSAALEVLTRFVTVSMQSAAHTPFEQEISRATSLIAAELASAIVQPELPQPHLIDEKPWAVPAPVEHKPVATEMPAAPEKPAAPPAPPANVIIPAAPVYEEPPIADAPPPVAAFEPEPPSEPVPVPVFVHEPEPTPEDAFRLDSLPPEEQELHRRAYRVAKVSMQDIKMLRPEDVRLGRENRDLCHRLRDDIEKAHKEYERRFQSISSHPVDYFYDWLVEILAGGDPEKLGEYPYSSPVMRR